MNKNIIIGVIVLLVIIAAWFIGQGSKTEPALVQKTITNYQPTQATDETATVDIEAPVKEIVMESFTEIIDGKYFPQFSLKEIIVNKGDLVRLKITVTSGRHDFKIDEFDVYTDTPTDEETVVEFVTDKAGEFIYYCARPGHRELGHWGTLKVVE